MGREIRRVPANWEHPKPGEYQPMFDETFEHAAQHWKSEFLKWEAGEKRENPREDGSLMEYWEWNGDPPDPRFYRPYKDEEGVWFQVYETVTEGTPVTPPFATISELVDHLCTVGEEGEDDLWTRENAEAFCRIGSAPSMICHGGRTIMGKDAMAFLEERALSRRSQ